MNNDMIVVTSGVNTKGVPFCHVKWTQGNRILEGQLTPDETRGMALGWLEAAEASEHDAAVFNELRDGMDMPPELAGAFIQALRARRLRSDVPEPQATVDLKAVTHDKTPGDVAGN